MVTWLVACGAPTGAADSGMDVDAAVPDAGEADAGPDDAGAPDAGTWALRWDDDVDFPFPIDHHGTFVARFDGGAALYVVGGALTGTNKDGGAQGSGDNAYGPVYDGVFAARIGDGGALEPLPLDGGEPLGDGTFARVRRLFPLAFHGLASDGNDAVAFGGVTAPDDAPNTTLSASPFALHLHVDDDGSVHLTGAARLRQVSLHPTASLVNGRVVVAGGTGASSAVMNTVWAAPLESLTALPDGGLPEPFVAQAPLPQPRSHHAALVHGGRVYLVGGYTTGEQPVANIWRSVHGVDGSIIGWDVAGTLDDPPWTASVFEHDGALYVVGGGTFAGGGTFLGRVRRAPFFPDGDLGFFTDVDDALPRPRGHVHQTPVLDGHVYSIGGRDFDAQGRIVSLRRVNVGHLERR